MLIIKKKLRDNADEIRLNLCRFGRKRLMMSFFVGEDRTSILSVSIEWSLRRCSEKGIYKRVSSYIKQNKLEQSILVSINYNVSFLIQSKIITECIRI